MGVPKFYRWISERYPQINQMISNSTLLPEIDNLYLDMNGIIHACTHPDDSSATRALTFRDMILAIFGYIDRIVTEIVKPKRKLFMAIDGVAPRAKLNQQRARRFRAAEDRLEAVRAAKKKGEEIDEQNMFDSNCITPGTEFMEKVGHHLRWFIRKKMKEDSIWKNLEITFSGHDVPGEGEHKIMQFIRESRCQPDYEPNQRHCMYGQDADLIMLGLATHEPHFTLLREVVNFTFGGGGKTVTKMKQTKQSQFQLLHLSILREYIELEFGANADCEVNKERLVDDFIFLTFLVGNDFLPHLPTLDIGEHAFDVIFTAYKSLLSESHGYLVCNGELADLSRFEKLCALIGVQEEQILQKREVDERDYNQKCRRRSNYSAVSTSIRSQAELDDIEEMEQLAFEEALREAMLGDADDDESDDSALDEVIEEESMNVTPFMSVARDDSDADINYEIVSKKSRSKRKQVMAKDTEESESNANTTKDYRGRYYYQKFKVLVQQDVVGDQFLNELISRYLEGLIWCLAYYCKGCVSWTWFFPYHYGPMLQDMKNLNIVIENVSFKIGQPFKPFQQLLGCLPPASASLMPQSYQWLMTSETSPVIGFYPFTFEVDMNGKRNPWEAVVLLPFIDENALLQAEEKYCPEKSLTTAERNRNSFGPALTHIFDPSNNSTYPSCNPEIFLPDIHMCYTSVSSYHPSLQPGIAFQNELIEGTATFMPGFPSLSSLGINDIETNFYKINVFGTASKYRTLVISINPDNSPWDEWTPKAIAKVINDKNNAEYDYDDDEDTAGPSPEEVVAAEDRLKSLLNSIVYVNYPQLHEARVVGISTETSSWRLSNQFDDLDNRIETVVHDLIDSEKWITDASQEEDRYLRGRGTPGSGGLNINRIYIRLRVCPLQGMIQDALTGSRKKLFGTIEADIPIQLVVWKSLAIDFRFQETDSIPTELLFPLKSEVISLTKVHPTVPAGCKGIISGINRNPLENGKFSTTANVIFMVPHKEPDFGYMIHATIDDHYYSSGEISRNLKISPSVLGRIVGAVFVEKGNIDIGLNFKRNGQYQLLGYSRRVFENKGNTDDNKTQSLTSVWGHKDAVRIVGSLPSAEEQQLTLLEKVEQTVASHWEYSDMAVAVIQEYMKNFPTLFQALEKNQNKTKYSARDLFGKEANQKLVEVMTWLSTLPIHSLPRTPLTTESMSKRAMIAVEKKADEITNDITNGVKPITSVDATKISLEKLYRSQNMISAIPSSHNSSQPKLGDRIVNLNSPGVPFGLRGTVVAIHKATGYVEVIFDSEFTGGRSLQGSCSQFRGKLCDWNDILRVSDPANAKHYEKMRPQAQEMKKSDNKKFKANKNSDSLLKVIHQKAIKDTLIGTASSSTVDSESLLSMPLGSLHKAQNITSLFKQKLSLSETKQTGAEPSSFEPQTIIIKKKSYAEATVKLKSNDYRNSVTKTSPVKEILKKKSSQTSVESMPHPMTAVDQQSSSMDKNPRMRKVKLKFTSKSQSTGDGSVEEKEVCEADEATPVEVIPNMNHDDKSNNLKGFSSHILSKLQLSASHLKAKPFQLSDRRMDDIEASSEPIQDGRNDLKFNKKKLLSVKDLQHQRNIQPDQGDDNDLKESTVKLKTAKVASSASFGPIPTKVTIKKKKAINIA